MSKAVGCKSTNKTHPGTQQLNVELASLPIVLSCTCAYLWMKDNKEVFVFHLTSTLASILYEDCNNVVNRKSCVWLLYHNLIKRRFNSLERLIYLV